MMGSVRVAVMVLLLVAAVSGHSWLQCADYSEENGQYWDASKCKAFPRDYHTKFGDSPLFGGDVGFNYQPTENTPCQTTQSGSSYTTAFPAATYAPGQRVCLAWPPKNHVAATCNNANIPDAGTWILRSDVNPTSDPTLSKFEANVVHDFGKNTAAGAGVGFQNCPDFCAQADKALCTGCFDVPKDLGAGKYTFMWKWAFNGPTDKYTTCWDVTISPTATQTKLTALPHVGPDDFKAAKAATLTAASTPVQTSGNGGTAGTAGTAGTSGSSGTSSAPMGLNIDFGPCPVGSLRCNCTVGGNCDRGLYCASATRVCVSNGDIPHSSNAGGIVAAVFITMLAVAGIAVALVFIARINPHSAIGSFMHKAMGSSGSGAPSSYSKMPDNNNNYNRF